MSNYDRIRLTHLAREFEPPPTYERLYKGILNGKYPAEQSDGGQWSVQRSDLPLIASALGLQRASEKAAA